MVYMLLPEGLEELARSCPIYIPGCKAIIVLAGRREVPGKEEWEKIIKEGKIKKPSRW